MTPYSLQLIGRLAIITERLAAIEITMLAKSADEKFDRGANTQSKHLSEGMETFLEEGGACVQRNRAEQGAYGQICERRA